MLRASNANPSDTNGRCARPFSVGGAPTFAHAGLVKRKAHRSSWNSVAIAVVGRQLKPIGSALSCDSCAIAWK